MAMSLSSGRRVVLRPRGRVSDRGVTLFARQLATLLGAGLPLMRSLETLRRQERSRSLRIVLADIASQVRGGASFSESLRPHHHVFDHLVISMVRAGEAAGNLPDVLARVADFR